MPLYTFLPWARPNLQNLPVETLTPALPVAARARVDLTLNTPGPPIGGDMLLDGPADVIGIDPRQITRMEPAPHTSNFESNYFAAVEFARPDLPWLFTPATANTTNQLRPWLVLAVVRKQPGVALLRPERQLPILEIKSPARAADELPDLAQSWAWAHAQIEERVAAGETLESLFATHPQRVGSRLLCPRKLEPDAGYFACVVPAFEAGRLAGLGQPTEPVTTLEPAWKPDASSVVLPVYHVWEFATGQGGDFESLLKRLLEPKAGSGEAPRPRMVDAANADEGMPPAPQDAAAGDTAFALECPLVPLGSARPWNESFAALIAAALRTILAEAEGAADPRVTAPIYAAAYAALRSLPRDGTGPAWLQELNFDPRYRIAASFGAEVVRRNQDRLVDSAWDQAGDIRAANALIRHAQAAAAAAAAVNRKHFSRLSDSALVEITRPFHARLAVDSGESFQAMMARTSAPPALATAEFRRAARPRGPVLRRTTESSQRSVRPIFQGISAQRLTLVLHRQLPPLATPDAVEGSYQAAGNARAAGTLPVSYQLMHGHDPNAFPQHSSFAIAPPALPTPFPQFFIFTPRVGPDNETAKRFREALLAHQRFLKPVVATAEAAPPVQFTLANVRQILEARLAPSATFTAAIRSMVVVPEQSSPDPLATMHMAPTFPEPLYAALGDISPDLVVQGFETIANETITPLETNTRFVEAFLAGANHEMARELVWREYPTEETTTFFQTFWDSRARTGTLQPDVPEITAWSPEKKLGENTTAASRAVFLIRGELIRRYPTAIVYLVEAGPPRENGQPTLGTKEQHPVIRGTLGPDAAFFGFDVPPEQVAGSPGWLFVIQEPPSEPRFGIEVDVTDQIQPAADAARTAQKFIQRPVRFAIHARDLLHSHG